MGIMVFCVGDHLHYHILGVRFVEEDLWQASSSVA
jgi:hypothetical protein